MPLEKQPDREEGSLHGRPERRHDGSDPDEFFGLDVEKMSPRGQVAAGLAVLLPVAVGVVLVLTLIPQFFWLIFIFGWTIFPAFGLLVRGIAGLSEDRSGLPSSASGKERELLEALREHGELTSAQAAMETSLTVAEADGKLKELAEGGHLQVRVHGGGLFYSLWEVEGGAELGQLGDR
jgi:hypothetical protein